MAAGVDLRMACRCGKVTALVHGATPQNGHRVRCHCRDCRAFARYIGADAALDENGGTALYHTVPGRIEFLTGAEHLRCLRLSPKGLLRWYTACCGTPMANMMPNPKSAFVGIPLLAFPDPVAPDAMGPEICTLRAKQAPPGSHPPADHGYLRAAFRIVRRLLGARIGLTPRGSPYFDARGHPIVTPRVLSRQERAAASAD